MISVEAPPAVSRPAPPAVPSSGWETLAPQIDLGPNQSGAYLPPFSHEVTAMAGEASFVDGEVVVLPPSIDPDAPLHIRIAGFAREAAVINGMDLQPDLYASYMRDLPNKYDLPGPREEGALPPASVGGANVVAAAAVVGHRAPGWFRALCATTALALGLSSCAPRSVPIGITAEPLPQPGLTQLPLETAPAPPTATGEQQSTATVEPLQIAYYGIRGAIPPLHAVDHLGDVHPGDLPSSALAALEDQGYAPLAFIGADGELVVAEAWLRPEDNALFCTVALPPERTAPDGTTDQLLTDPADAVKWPEAYAYADGYGVSLVYEYGLPNGPGTTDDEVTAKAIAGVTLAGIDPEAFTCVTLITADSEKTPQKDDFAGATYIGLVEKDTGNVTATIPLIYDTDATIIFDGNAYSVDGQTLAFSLSPDGTVTTTLGPAIDQLTFLPEEVRGQAGLVWQTGADGYTEALAGDTPLLRFKTIENQNPQFEVWVADAWRPAQAAPRADVPGWVVQDEVQSRWWQYSEGVWKEIDNPIVPEGMTLLRNHLGYKGLLRVVEEAGKIYYRLFIDGIASTGEPGRANEEDFAKLGISPDGESLLSYLREHGYILPEGLVLPIKGLPGYVKMTRFAALKRPILLDGLYSVVLPRDDTEGWSYVESLGPSTLLWSGGSMALEKFGMQFTDEGRIVIVSGGKEDPTYPGVVARWRNVVIGGVNLQFNYDRDATTASQEAMTIVKILNDWNDRSSWCIASSTNCSLSFPRNEIDDTLGGTLLFEEVSPES